MGVEGRNMPDKEAKDEASSRYRWLFLIAAITSMMVVGLYQYSWALFVHPMEEGLGWSRPVIQLTFTIFLWVMTLTQPLAGVFADREGPRILNIVGALIAGIGWVASSQANTPETLYLAYGLGGVGVGIFYATSIGIANKWFPDRRGLATGLASFGYGFGAAVLNPIIYIIINTFGFRTALLRLGLGMLATLVLMGLLIVYPDSGWTPQVRVPKKPAASKTTETVYQYGMREMVSTRQWWHIYLAFVLTANLGLMVTPQLDSIGDNFNLTNDIIIIALSTWPFANSLGRIIGGRVSDRFGRERTMAIYFSIQGVLTMSLLKAGWNPTLFVIVVTLLGLMWGPIFTFFPAVIADYYGRKNSTANYGLTYTAKGWGGSLGTYVLSLLAIAYGGYSTPIIVSAIFSFSAAALIAPRILKRPR